MCQALSRTLGRTSSSQQACVISNYCFTHEESEAREPVHGRARIHTEIFLAGKPLMKIKEPI